MQTYGNIFNSKSFQSKTQKDLKGYQFSLFSETFVFKMTLNFLENVSLKNYNTFGINAIGKYFIEINNFFQVIELIETPLFNQFEHLVLGGGSNLLFTKNFDGLIIHLNIPGLEVVSETETTVQIKAGAGMVWNDLVQHCVSKNIGGIENLVLIPGKTGAAPIQNIGAYGIEIKDIFSEVKQGLNVLSTSH